MVTSKYIMDSKKSLGYSPLGMISHEDSQFDFIADRKPVKEPKKSLAEENVSRLIEERPSPISTTQPKKDKSESEDIFNEFLSKTTDSGILDYSKSEKEELSKKTASYYMSTDTIQSLRDYADKNDETYSSVAEIAIKAYLNNL